MTATLIDLSGLVGSVLQSYLGVVDKCRQLVTGDPAALRAAAQRHADQAARLTSVGGQFTSCDAKLAPIWQGSAHEAFHGSAVKLSADLNEVAAQLRTESQRLAMAGAAISVTMSTMDNVRAQFVHYAQDLINQARTASASQVGAFLSAAKQLGESAVSAARTVEERLASALRQLFGLSGVESPEHEGPGTVKIDFEQLKRGPLTWIGDEILNGRKRPRSVPSAFANSGWYKLGADGLTGTRAPRKDDTPFGAAELPEHASTGRKLWHETNVSLWKLSEEHSVLGDASWGGKLESHGEHASGDLHLYAGPRATVEAGVGIHSRQFRVDGSLKATLLDAGASGVLADGPVTARGDVGGFVGGQANAHLDAGLHGVAAHVDAFAGAKLTGAAAVDVAGIGVGAKGELEVGLGAQLDGQATWDNGHVKVNFKVGAALGVGAGFGADIDVDVPKVWHTAQHYGHDAIESVEHTASAAASAVGWPW
ncbi:WXG100 family type VII secretion target [Kutzneria albida]|uniref:WXG100 family type VII secretion target n=1 Tax=Kutzneria albida DSM 43870 TaxID=1449976 RepID=W5WFN5_9PSEU|nr:WXG100 family type VII secretion target [Kutzneria albida]AHH99416.1 hypothetical protein KALB_6056 [Kutzneria albida DSM 43870]